ncbi:hypothetical protein V1520DRAFT_370226 [Lipomyces starkeyi]|uniref:Uncharacterized protein n=1 Tax=Lipomyces starkeyi NRRL Y-11557 TaxID=675824 RepID=A0A1E3Q8V7_LIPST|nr:hypothetical protein LIPSTDRAFT_69654 [Lipomyces starkeyi NRRL Y-11557]
MMSWPWNSYTYIISTLILWPRLFFLDLSPAACKPSNLPIATVSVCTIHICNAFFLLYRQLLFRFLLVRGVLFPEEYQSNPFAKLDAIGMEYTYLLTSQPESHDPYFEDKMAAAADKASATLKKAETPERGEPKRRMTR